MKFIAAIIGAIISIAIVVFGMIGLILGFSLIMAFPTMWLWNYVVPYISNGTIPTIDIWHSLALNILCGILFKSRSSSSKKDDE